MNSLDAAHVVRRAMKGQYLGTQTDFLRAVEDRLFASEPGESITFFGLPFGKGTNPNGCMSCRIAHVSMGDFERVPDV